MLNLTCVLLSVEGSQPVVIVPSWLVGWTCTLLWGWDACEVYAAVAIAPALPPWDLWSLSGTLCMRLCGEMKVGKHCFWGVFCLFLIFQQICFLGAVLQYGDTMNWRQECTWLCRLCKAWLAHWGRADEAHCQSLKFLLILFFAFYSCCLKACFSQVNLDFCGEVLFLALNAELRSYYS